VLSRIDFGKEEGPIRGVVTRQFHPMKKLRISTFLIKELSNTFLGETRGFFQINCKVCVGQKHSTTKLQTYFPGGDLK